MNSFIPWVGGKGKLLWIINKMAPERYSRFIDVFGGSGTVTMNRPTRHGCMEVYNDFNGNLTNLFCCVKSRTLALLSELGFLPLNTNHFTRIKRRITSLHQERVMSICWTEDGFNMAPPEQPTLSEIKTEKEQNTLR